MGSAPFCLTLLEKSPYNRRLNGRGTQYGADFCPGRTWVTKKAGRVDFTMKTEASGVAYYVSKKVGKAVWDYRMLKDGDRILVAVSGGKDSLVLLSVMEERKRFLPVKHEIIACHVDMGFDWVNIDLLKDYFEGRGINYVIASPNDQWLEIGQPPDCFWCSWTRRKALFNMAAQMGCTKIALGHHLDDISETVLLNLLFRGEIGTMRPYQEMFNGRLAIIRPLAYVDEKYLTRFANHLGLPAMTSRCPQAGNSKRRLVKEIIAQCCCNIIMSPPNCKMKMSPLTITTSTEGRCSSEKRSDVHGRRGKAVRRDRGSPGR